MTAQVRQGVVIEGLDPDYLYPVARLDSEYVVIVVDGVEVVCPADLFDIEGPAA